MLKITLSPYSLIKHNRKRLRNMNKPDNYYGVRHEHTRIHTY